MIATPVLVAAAAAMVLAAIIIVSVAQWRHIERRAWLLAPINLVLLGFGTWSAWQHDRPWLAAFLLVVIVLHLIPQRVTVRLWRRLGR